MSLRLSPQSKIIFSLVAVLLCAVAGFSWWFITQPTFQHNTRSTKHIDLQRLEKTVRVLSEEYVPRDYRHPANLNKCAAYIRQHFMDAGADATTYQPFSVGGVEYINIRARFGSGATQLLVVGAHYDAFETTPGADDNASGVAGLIELAYLLGQHPVPGSVELVAYSLEEPPFFATQQMGSAYHAAKLFEQGISVSLMISLEMIGYFTDQPGSQSFPYNLLRWFYPDSGNFIAVVGNLAQREVVKTVKASMRGTTDLPVYAISAPAGVPGIDFSDHRNYWPYGYPAVMVTDTGFYRNTAYHGAGDTADRLDYVRMGKVVVGVYETVLKFQQTAH